jgi:DNA-binding PadR family transcriptional regulator
MTDIDLSTLDRELKKGAAERRWIKGIKVEKAGERRRRFCRLMPTGQRVLVRQRQTWDEFVEAVRLVTRAEHA